MVKEGFYSLGLSNQPLLSQMDGILSYKKYDYLSLIPYFYLSISPATMCSNPELWYSLKLLAGEKFSGLHLICLMFFFKKLRLRLIWGWIEKLYMR